MSTNSRRNFLKLGAIAQVSLSVAVAMATLSSANAQPLVDAIKNVEVSGTVVYRYNDYTSDKGGKNGASNTYKAVVNLKSKVNDDVTANTSIAINNNFLSFKTSEGDENHDLELTKMNFAYTGLKNTTITLGKQGIDTPFTKASHIDGNEQTGSGIMAISTWNAITIAGGYFNQTNFDESGAGSGKGSKDYTDGLFDGSEDVMTFGVMSNCGPIAVDAWYLALDGGNVTDNTNTHIVDDNSFDSYTIGANYKFAISNIKFALDARYSSLDFDSEEANAKVGGKSNTTENELWEIGLNAKMGIFGTKLAYGQTGEDGGFVALDNNAKTGMNGWMADLNGRRDASMIKANINAQVTKEINVALNYNDVDSDGYVNDKKDHEETYTQVTYKMSKNFSTYVRYGQRTETNDSGRNIDSDIGRLQVMYLF